LPDTTTGPEAGAADIPSEMLLTDLPAFCADIVSAMGEAQRHRDGAYLNGDGGDLGGGVSATLVVRHAANHLAVLQVARSLGLTDGDLLDVGCGTGAPASTLASWLGSRLHLCDQDAGPLGVAERAFAPQTATTDLATSPQGDVVTCMDVIEHLAPADQDAFVAAMAAKVRPGGLLALATPDETSYPGGFSGYHPHVGCLSPDELAALLTRATGAEATVLRLVGGPFALDRRRQVQERVLNTAWAKVLETAPAAAERLARLGERATVSAAAVDETAQVPVVAVAPSRTESTGMVGMVRL
jgi:2-polyprenyl-3-methyl-5-hydroxy-6-metoxy-1,4-benzoquinol methylase